MTAPPTSPAAGPDPTRCVFTCIHEDCGWQVQTNRRAKLSFGSAVALLRAIAETFHEHISTAHPDWQPGLTLSDGQSATGACMVQLLPRWWVERT